MADNSTDNYAKHQWCNYGQNRPFYALSFFPYCEKSCGTWKMKHGKNTGTKRCYPGPSVICQDCFQAFKGGVITHFAGG